MPLVAESEELKLARPPGGPPPVKTNDDWRGGDGDSDGDRSRYVPGAGLLAMRFVLVSITALFVTIGVAYFTRSKSPINWQHIAVPPFLWLSTALILASGWTLENARASFNRRIKERYILWLEITAGIGLAFLGSQLLALRELVDQGLYLRENPHSSLFYVITAAHGIHLMGGIAALCYLLLRASAGGKFQFRDIERQRSRGSVTALYWHFLTVLWLALFIALLLWP